MIEDSTNNQRKKVFIPRGIPGSGKSTFVREQQSRLDPGETIRISNDDLSAMLFNNPWGTFFSSTTIRDILSDLRISMLTVALKSPEVKEIYIDNTNISITTVNRLAKVAQKYDAEFIVLDQFLSVPLEECIRRDSLRPNPVTEEPIRSMYKDAQKLKPYKPLPFVQILPYQDNHDPILPGVFLIDIDGTIALKSPDRGIHDYHKVHLDRPNTPVVRIVNTLINEGYRVIFLTGRKDDCRIETATWIRANIRLQDDDEANPFQLIMRKTGDNRPDWIIKHELFQEHIAGKYRVLGCFDDRNQVVEMYRKLGLTVYQVADGDF